MKALIALKMKHPLVKLGLLDCQKYFEIKEEMAVFKRRSSKSTSLRGTAVAGIDFSFGLINVNSLSKQSTTSSATKYCSFHCS